MRLSLAASALAAVVLLQASAPVAGAQSAATPAVAGAPTVAPATPWSAAPVGTYDLVAEVHGESMPATLVVTDSAGTVRGSLWPAGDPAAHPVSLAANGTDLVLELQTRSGTMTIVLQRRGDQITGRWERGAEGGTISGKVRA